MVTVRYRKDRRVWEVDYRRHGVRSRPEFHSRKTAKEFARKMEDLIERDRHGLHKIEPITFGDFGALFVANHFVEKSEKYKRTVTLQIERIFGPIFGDKQMTDISTDDIIAFKEIRKGEGLAPKTIREDISLLSLMFHAAIKNGYAGSNPVEDVELPKNTPRKVRQAVPDEDLRKGLRHFKETDLHVALMLRNSGLRVGELFRLDERDFSHDTHTTLVRSVVGGTTKSYRTRETVFTPTMAAILALHAGKPPKEWVRRRTFDGRFFELKAKLGFSWDLHSLRHAFNTKLRNANIPKHIAEHYMGHKGKSVNDTYTSYTRDFVEAVCSAVDFGMEFLTGKKNVVTMRSPEKRNHLEINGLVVPGAGLEPGQSKDFNKLPVREKNQKNQRVFKKG